MVEAYLEASPSGQADGGSEAGDHAMEAEVVAGPKMEVRMEAGAEGAAQVEAVVAVELEIIEILPPPQAP